MELSRRQQTILKVVVENYVLTAAPVSSEKIAGQSGLKVSSATVRNDMVELEEMGLLTHPHTSAGRMPSDLGYRYYIEHLMFESSLTSSEQQTVWHQFHQVEAEIDQWGPLAAAIMAQMARTAALVTKIHASVNRVKRLELISVQDDLVLAVLILQSGGVQQRVFRLDQPVGRDELMKIANRLSDILGDKTSSEMIAAASTLSGLEGELASLVARLMEQSERFWVDDIYYEGIGFVSSEPEFGQAERLIGLVDVFRRGHWLAPLLTEVLDDGGLRVIIGSENEPEQMRGYSVILNRYGVSGQAAGVLGIVGPTRMRYWRAVSLVRFMSGLMDQLVDRSMR